MKITALSMQGIKVASDPFVLLGAGATGLSICWWLSIMPNVKVSAVYPLIQAGAIITTLVLSNALLNERLSSAQMAGIAVLIAGLFLTSSGR